MKIFLTGSNGLVGGKILSIAQRSHEVIATARQAAFQKSNKFEYFDINDQAKLNYLLDIHKPDVFVNSAAISKVDLCQTEKSICHATNYRAAVSIADACKKRDIHLVHLSTDFVFDGKTGMYKEEDLPSPVNYYGETKLKAEEYILQSGVKAAIIRTVLVYGFPVNPTGSNILTWVIKSLKEKKKIRVVNDQFRTPTLVSDLASACLKIADKKLEDIWHIAGNEYLSVYEFAIKTAKAFGLDENLISPVTSAELNEKAARPPKTGFRLSKAMLEIDYHPHNIEEGLAVIKSETEM